MKAKYPVSKQVNLSARFLGCFLFFLLTMFLASAAEAKTITIDGDFSDWSGAPKIISDNLDPYPYPGTAYYYNLETDDWQTDDPGYSTCMYNVNRVLEVSEMWMVNDNNYLYMKLRRGASFTHYYWLRGGGVEWAHFYDEPASSFNSNPCAGRTITAPAAFSHDLVFNFDKDRDGRFDYYLGFDMSYQKGAYRNKDTGKMEPSLYTITTHIMKDDGDGVYTGDNNEIFLTNVEKGERGFSNCVAADDGGVFQEFKVDLEKFLSYTEMKTDELYNVRYASHSEQSNMTSTGNYSLEKDKQVRLSVNIPRKTKKQSVLARGQAVSGTNLRVLVDGEEQDSFDVGKSGRFRRRVPLSFGGHSIQLVAYNETKGTKNITRSVTRNATRAIDMPLGLDVIRCKNETKNSIIRVEGTAYGVDVVDISVNGASWGKAAVKRKSGYYYMEVRLGEGENVIGVTATDESGTVTATKKVRKI